jgi:cobalt/nickel transport system permease protein
MMSGLLVFMAGVSFRKLLSLLSCPFTFLSLGVIGIIVSITTSGADSLVALHAGNYWLIITKENLHQGIYLTLRALASVCCLYFLALTTPMTEIMSILKKIGVPAILREMISLIYRSIFILLEMANYIHLSQDSRLGYSNFRRSYYSLSQLISCIFLKSCNHANQMHKALISRGYDGDINLLEPEYKISKSNWIKICIVEILLLAIIFGGKIFG